MSITLFVYGSLRRGGWANDRLAQADYLASTTTAPTYGLVDLGDYPGLFEDGTTSVVGELYSVTEPLLAELDHFEGHPHLFKRASVKLADGRLVTAYLVPKEHVLGRPLIASGDWLVSQESNGHATD